MRKSAPHFATPQQVLDAFYEALVGNDWESMMEVWAEDEEIVCVHPGGPRLVGYSAIRMAWREILGAGAQMRFELREPMLMVNNTTAIQSVLEFIQFGVERGRQGIAIATNIMILTANGWRLLIHHASATQAVEASPPIPPEQLH